jgi:thiosulfate/3-mercaptopyruvate sulfurtransferase
MNTFTSPLVETTWLAANLAAPDLRIIDCSVVRQDNPDGSYSFVTGRPAWEQAHIPGSIFVDVPGELSDPQAATSLMMPPIADFARIMGRKGIGDDTTVVLYDNSNHAWAARVWWMLRVCGFDKAAVLNGGWQKWRAEGRPVSTTPTAYPAAQLTPRPRPELMADKQTVRAALGNKDVSLIYALSPAAYSGAAKLFARAGRIPGSKNVYCEFLLDPNTLTYLDLDRLRALFAPTGALDAGKVITYCGGGIAASSDALALTALGLKHVAVYDGSMAEWTADPALPLESD